MQKHDPSVIAAGAEIMREKCTKIKAIETTYLMRKCYASARCYSIDLHD